MRPVKRAKFVVAVLCLAGLTVQTMPNPAEARLASVVRPTAVDSAESAVRQLMSGETSAAAVTIRQALDAEPGNTLLHNLAGSLLMLTGDTAGAAAVWTDVLAESPGDSIALYGLGLTSLAKGDRNAALDRFELAQRGGDGVACLLAGRYVEILNGSKGAGTGLALPDAYAATARAVSGISAERAGDHARAMSELSAALGLLPGDPFGEPQGLVMTFRVENPIHAAALPLPAGNGLVSRHSQPREKRYSGVITLRPDGLDSDTGFVAFKIDGTINTIVNTSPFSLVWNTARVANGAHRVEIIVYDRRGQESSRATKSIKTTNLDAPTAVRDEVVERRLEGIRAEIWKCLTLLPSRNAIAVSLAEAARASGDRATADRYLLLSAALDPDFSGTRSRWVAEAGSVAGPALYRGAQTENVVALTFDDGPKPGVTEKLVEVLKRERVPATFFVIGRHAAEYPNLVKLIADAGMEIENHTYTHPNLTMLSRSSIERELMRTIAAVKSATGRTMHYFRPPGGNLSSDVTKVAADWGLTPCMWTVTADSLEYGNGDQLVEYVLRYANPGGIIIMHNGRMTTVEALPRIIAGLRRRGYSFATVEQLAQRKNAMAHPQNSVAVH